MNSAFSRWMKSGTHTHTHEKSEQQQQQHARSNKWEIPSHTHIPIHFFCLYPFMFPLSLSWSFTYTQSRESVALACTHSSQLPNIHMENSAPFRLKIVIRACVSLCVVNNDGDSIAIRNGRRRWNRSFSRCINSTVVCLVYSS